MKGEDSGLWRFFYGGGKIDKLWRKHGSEAGWGGRGLVLEVYMRRDKRS